MLLNIIKYKEKRVRSQPIKILKTCKYKIKSRKNTKYRINKINFYKR